MVKNSLVEMIDVYLSKKTASMNTKDKKSVIKFFEKIKEEADKEGLLQIKYDNDADALTRIVEDIISAAKKSKTEKAIMYNKFVQELTKSPKYLGYSAPLMPVDVPLTTLERRLDIIKNYGNKKKQTNKVIAEKYNVESKIISNDIREIQAGELNVFGQEFHIDALVSTEKDEIKSTVVPLVLAANVEEVIALLEGLYKHELENTVFRKYAEHIAGSLWSQLSDEVKDKIQNSKMDMKLDTKWYRTLENKAREHDRSFRPEREYYDIESKALMFGKEGATCDIQYNHDGVVQQLREVTIVGIGSKIESIILEDGKEIMMSEIEDIRRG